MIELLLLLILCKNLEWKSKRCLNSNVKYADVQAVIVHITAPFIYFIIPAFYGFSRSLWGLSFLAQTDVSTRPSVTPFKHMWCYDNALPFCLLLFPTGCNQVRSSQYYVRVMALAKRMLLNHYQTTSLGVLH